MHCRTVSKTVPLRLRSVHDVGEPLWLELILHFSMFGLKVAPAAALTALMLGAPAAVATLGQTPSTFPTSASSSGAPGARLLAVTPGPPFGPYVVYQNQLDTGTELREYTGPDGVVFAVSWRGPVLPDLNALLGTYFAALKSETELRRMGGRRGSPVNVRRDGLVIASNGRMRNFFGYAYAPGLVPPGVAINDVLLP